MYTKFNYSYEDFQADGTINAGNCRKYYNTTTNTNNKNDFYGN